MSTSTSSVAVVGGGPAGLWAAESAARGGAAVTIYEANPAPGRKLLVAGRKGLNLTSSVDDRTFLAAYSGSAFPPDWLAANLARWGSRQLREWIEGSLGLATFESSGHKVFPEPMKGGPVLRRWLDLLETLGIQVRANHRWSGVEAIGGEGYQLQFEGGTTALHDRVILALGGGSWTETGSDGAWTEILEALGIEVARLEPANCGWNIEWPPAFLALHEGRPLKNLSVSAGQCSVKGELVVTRYGLEGGPLYHLGPAIRAMSAPEIRIDFKPRSSVSDLVRKMDGVKRNHLDEACRRWKLCVVTRSLIEANASSITETQDLAQYVKEIPLFLDSPRPLDEAISSAGGVTGMELDQNLMLKKLPGFYVAGEMLDWEAPTGGFLLQGCFLTGRMAGEAAGSVLPGGN